MKRRNFLKLSAGTVMATTALNALPKFVVAQNSDIYDRELYSNNFRIEKDEGQCSTYISKKSLDEFIASKSPYLEIEISYTNYLKVGTENGVKHTKTYWVNNIKKEVVYKNNTHIDVYKIYFKPHYNKIPIFSAMNQLSSLDVVINNNVLCKANDGNLITELRYVSNSFDLGEDDCFVTTACVKYQNLKDDCDELQTLRTLRDKQLRNTTYGDERIFAYESYGPKIVEGLEKLANKKEVYQVIYNEVVLPTVALAKQNQHQAAVTHYVDCMIGIWQRLEEVQQ